MLSLLLGVTLLGASIASESYFPMRELSKQEYFAPLADHTPVLPWNNKHIPTAPIVRKSNLSKAEFYDLVREGQPFVVDDCADGWPYKEWSCEDFGKAWPTGHMKAEYSENQQHIKLGDGLWWKKVRDGESHKEHISQGKMLAGPYIWHVKDEEPLETKQSVQKNWRSPYFFNDTAANALEAWDSFEFWFSLPGGGAFAHSDSYCEMTISTQLRGHKTWRLMMYPEVPNVFESFESFDTGVYAAKKWSPEYEFEVGPGQCFLFPPGYMHETMVKPETNSECSVATTFQYNLPFPTKYIRNFLPRLFSSHLIWAENCHTRWESFHTLSGTGLKPTTDTDTLNSRVRAVFKQVDADKDGFLSSSEVFNFLSESPSAEWAREVSYSWTRKVSAEERAKVKLEQLESKADDTISYSDLDADGLVSEDELYKSTLQWNVLNQKFHKLRALDTNTKAGVLEALQIEREFHSKYNCGESKDSKFCLGDNYFEALKKKVRTLRQLNAYQSLAEGRQDEAGGQEEEEEEEEEDGADDGGDDAGGEDEL